MAILLAAGRDNKKIAKAVKVNPETVRLWLKQFKGLDSISRKPALAPETI